MIAFICFQLHVIIDKLLVKSEEPKNFCQCVVLSAYRLSEQLANFEVAVYFPTAEPYREEEAKWK